MDRVEAFRNLILMAAVDGKLTKDEIAFLSLRSSSWGISDEQFQQALEAMDDPNAELTLPPSKAERLDTLADLVRMMAVDGELAEVEKQLFAVAAAVMEISQDELNQLLDELLRSG